MTFLSPNPIRPIKLAEFRNFQRLIHREAGIFLSDAKQALLVGRLARRMRELEMTTFQEYYEYVVASWESESVVLFNAICTNETQFFREPRQFELLRESIAPQWIRDGEAGRREKVLRVWSAACSSGEEPYSIAMTLLDVLNGDTSWRVEVIATDLSLKILERARAAMWPVAKSASIPSMYLRRFMLKGTRSQEGFMTVAPEVRSIVQFHRMNLNDDTYPFEGGFDAIFCRNVLIYFDAEGKRRVVHRLASLLRPAGHFFLGHAETLNGTGLTMLSVGPTVYQRRALAVVA